VDFSFVDLVFFFRLTLIYKSSLYLSLSRFIINSWNPRERRIGSRVTKGIMVAEGWSRKEEGGYDLVGHVTGYLMTGGRWRGGHASRVLREKRC
jgi:hypothetical protein